MACGRRDEKAAEKELLKKQRVESQAAKEAEKAQKEAEKAKKDEEKKEAAKVKEISKAEKLALREEKAAEKEAKAVERAEKKARAEAKKAEPKKPRTAYFIFCAERRGPLVEANPELKSKVTEVAKLLAAEWKEVSAEQKTALDAQAAAERDTYLLECDAAGVVPDSRYLPKEPKPEKAKKGSKKGADEPVAEAEEPVAEAEEAVAEAEEPVAEAEEPVAEAEEPVAEAEEPVAEAEEPVAEAEEPAE